MNDTLSRRIAAAVLLIASAFAVACEDATTARAPVSEEQPLRIVTTIKPVELMVRDLVPASMRDLVDVAVLIPPDVSPHGFEPTPGQMAKLRSADIIIHVGLGLDDWAVRDLPRGTVALRFADVLGDEADHHHHHHHHDHDHSECDHDHGPIDEHLWLDVALVNTFASMCAAEIGRHLNDVTDGKGHETLQASLDAFMESANEVDAAFAEALSEHAGRRIVTHHNVFIRLAERYNLGDPVVVRPVEVLEPTPGDIRRAIEAVRSESLSFIFIEPQFSTVAAERIREETGVRLILVDPLGIEAESWAGMMRTLLDALVQGLGTDHERG